VLILTLSVASGALADPVPLPTEKMKSDIGRIASVSVTFLVNLPVNFVLLGLLTVATLKVLGPGLSDLPKTRARFVKMFAVSIILISLLGALTDFALLHEATIEIDQGTSPSNSIEWNLLGWFAAALLVFLSILAVTSLVLRMDMKLGAVLAFGMATLNVIWWAAIMMSDLTVTVTLVASLVLLPPTVWLLSKWHEAAHPEEDSRAVGA